MRPTRLARRPLAAALAAAAASIAAPAAALAADCQQSCPTGTVCLRNPLQACSVPELVSNILKAGIGIVGSLALLVFIYGGFLWLTSGGEPGKIKEGKEAMKWAAIGLIVIFSSYALVTFVFKAFTGN